MAGSNQLCLVSMILGITGVASSLCCALLALPLAIGAMATGIIGLVQLQPGQQGRGQAIAGLACGAVGLVVPIALLVFQVGVFSLSGQS